MALVNIIFGSNSGNTEIVIRKISQVLTEKNHKVQIIRAENLNPNQLTEADFTILASPTYAHGELQQHMKPVEKLIRSSSKSGHKFAVVGLGDNKYDSRYTIESATILEKAVKESEGELILDALRIHKSPIPQLEKVTEWATELSNQISS